MSIEKKSLISTLKTTKKANVAREEFGHSENLVSQKGKPLTLGKAKPLTLGKAKPLTLGKVKPLTLGKSKPLTAKVM